MDRIPIGIVGYGYWGPNLVRNFSACSATHAVAVLDTSAVRRATAERAFSHVKAVGTLEELIDCGVEAVAIATPVGTHFSLARQCLEHGLHVLVEKPLAASVDEAHALIDLAERYGKVLMVDHTYLFSNPVRRIKQIIESDELGELYYVDSIRINLGLFQSDVNVIWDLAPHDLSIVDYVLGLDPRSISAWGCAHTPSGIEDIAYVNMDYGDRLLANFHVNWMSPVKVRQMIFAGSKKSLIFNELNVTEPIKVYDRGIELGEGAEASRKLQIGYRSGDVWSPFIESREALQTMVAHFADCIRSGEAPLSDAWLGTRVVRYLEAATRSIRAQGGRVVLSNHRQNGASHGPVDRRELLAHSAGR
jgi:predicted dehydrogenase